MSKKCKCSPQSVDTLQFFEGSNSVVYCTKCKSPKKKKIDQSKRKLDQSNHAKLIKEQEAAIISSANVIKAMFKSGKERVDDSKQQKQLISQINDLIFYHEVAHEVVSKT
jgi:RNA polymerase-interacting CarD/CdnL/TRCF family regulator